MDSNYITGKLAFFSSRGGADDIQIKVAEKEKSVPVSFEITTTFSVEKDPFALDIGEDKGAFRVILDGETVYSTEEGIKDRVTFLTEEFILSSGKHELFIKANPPAEADLSNSVRVRVLAAGNPITDETLWFSPGQTVNAAYSFELKNEVTHD